MYFYKRIVLFLQEMLTEATQQEYNSLKGE